MKKFSVCLKSNFDQNHLSIVKMESWKNQKVYFTKSRAASFIVCSLNRYYENEQLN